jgi:hypothetical protein
LVLLWKSFHNVVTDKHVPGETFHDERSISGYGTINEAVGSILLFEEEIANLQILSAIVSACVHIPAQMAAAFDSNRHNRFATTPAASASPDLV